MREKKYKFDGEKWNSLSPRYQTRRNQEKVQRDSKNEIKLKEYNDILVNSDNTEEIRVTKLRLKSLKERCGIKKVKKVDEIKIPFRTDKNIILYVSESKVFTCNKLDLYTFEEKQNRLTAYKKLMYDNI
jgi:predicted metal-dependent hydrolase